MVCKHKGKDGECLIACEKDYIEYCHEGPCTKEKPMTNADRIRSMTDEELAEVIVEWCPNPEDGKCECTPYKDLCTRCWLTWLQQEVKE